MRIAAIELEDLRRFAGRWRVGPFAPGLNVLAAPNEAGKSSLLAAVQAAIFLPHRGAADALRPLGGGVPAVRVELADSAGLWVIAKRFGGRVARAEVATPAGQTLTGDAAEEEIRRLFGVAPEPRRREVPRGVWGALWVEQGHSFDLSGLDDPARRTLRSALEAEVGTVTGAAGIARLRAAIAQQLRDIQTPTRREPTGRLRDLNDRRANVHAALAELRQRRSAVEHDLARLAELREQRTERQHQRIAQTLEQKRDEARAQLADLERARERRDTALRDAEAAVRLAETAVRERDQRRRDRDDWHEAEDEARRAQEAAHAADAVAKAAEEAAARAALRAEAVAAVTAARQARGRAEALANAARRLEDARAAEARLAQAQPTAAAAMVGAAALFLAAVVLAALPVVVTALTDTSPWLLGAATVALVGAAVLLTRAVGRRRAAKSALAAAARECTAAQASAETLAGSAGIAAARNTAEREAAEAEAHATELRGRAGLPPEEAAERADALQRLQTEAEQAKDAADRAARAAAERSAEARMKAQAAGQRAARLAEARTREPDEALEERARTLAEEAERQKQAALTLLMPTEEERRAIAVAIERFEKELAAARAEDQKIADDIAFIEGGLARIEAEGLDEQIAAHEGEHARLDQEIAQLEARRTALNLLDETLREAEQEATASWLEPVARTLAPWLDRLIPGARATLDEATLQPAGLSRSGRDETFAILSRGTQEQIAVLVRLTFAEILCRQGRPAPVILDDALVFSDDDRIERMFDILSAAAERMQIVVLTCRTGLFARLGGHRLALERVA
jgi:uncharacterized protein YhaN